MSGSSSSVARATRGQLVLTCALLVLLALAQQLLARPQASASPASSASSASSASAASATSSASSLSSTSIVRLRSSAKTRRPLAELCRENLPRRADDLPSLVVTARVKEVFFENGPGESAPAADNKALLSVKRVIKGNQQLLNSDILVAGFNQTNSSPCPNYVKANDTYILLLNQDAERRYSIHNGNLFSLNLNNLERVNALAADEPYRRRPAIDDILCEAHYCAYGRCVVRQDNQPACDCPTSCPPLPSPVCSSDNTTYTNECHLIKEGCKRQRPLFVTKEASC